MNCQPVSSPKRSSSLILALFLVFVLAMLSGCAGNSSSNTTAALEAKNINLIFVASPDLAYQAPGDIQPDTANITSQGLTAPLF